MSSRIVRESIRLSKAARKKLDDDFAAAMTTEETGLPEFVRIGTIKYEVVVVACPRNRKGEPLWAFFQDRTRRLYIHRDYASPSVFFAKMPEMSKTLGCKIKVLA